jgi:DNA-binding response OmpR family regulator
MRLVRLRVVLADDDEELREACATALEASDYDVVTLDDGFELTDYFELTQSPGAQMYQPDLVITDLRMPGPAALDVLRRARAQGLACPIIVLTAYGDAASRETARHLGRTVVLDKPATQTALLALVEALLSPRFAVPEIGIQSQR